VAALLLLLLLLALAAALQHALHCAPAMPCHAALQPPPPSTLCAVLAGTAWCVWKTVRIACTPQSTWWRTSSSASWSRWVLDWLAGGCWAGGCLIGGW
jgi:hypothetical protein